MRAPPILTSYGLPCSATAPSSYGAPTAGLAILLASLSCSPDEGAPAVSSAPENDESTYVIEATFIGSLAVAATSEQLCGLNVPVKDAVYRVEIQHSLSDVHVNLASFGCSFPASRGLEGIVAENVACELAAQSSLHSYGISERMIVAFEFDPERDILRMLYTDLARGVTREDDELVRYCGILEASSVGREGARRNE